ncbi:MAG: amidohydrolase [Acidobacteria bacterium]|nr:amidohydrolase [Acidobacteriota bacterium]
MFTLLLTVPLLSPAQPASPAGGPDIVYFHAKILTGAHLRANDPSGTPAQASALAVSRGRIVAVGSDADILRRKGPQTKIVDLGGAFMMPGFNDAHTHIASAGQQKLTIDLDGTTSLAEMQQRIRAFAAKAAPGAWLQGGGWDHTKWPGKTLPTRQDIDAVSGGHPAVLERTDGHILIANSAALAAAGITRDTPDPAGGKIDHDATGELTGILREGPAMSILYKVVPPPTTEERCKALALAIDDALAHGVTSVQDLSSWEDFLVLEDMEKAGKLHLRVSEWLAFGASLDTLKKERASHPADDPLLRTGMLKGFMDGSLGSRTAALAAPYSDDPGNSGIPRYDQATLDAMTKERADAGFQVGLHVIGDQANHMALDAFEAADANTAQREKADMNTCFSRLSEDARKRMQEGKLFDPCGVPRGSPSYYMRYRIEHAQVLLPADFDLYRQLGVIASMQPSHLLTDMNWAEERLGSERAKYSYAWRSMLDHHIPLAFGTDYPVESINPFRGLYAAITRQNEAGTRTYQPQEKIMLNEAIYAYTQGSAFAEFRERDLGRLEPGSLADFVVLDRDITSTTPQQLLHTNVLRTVVSGETVYTASGANGGPSK